MGRKRGGLNDGSGKFWREANKAIYGSSGKPKRRRPPRPSNDGQVYETRDARETQRRQYSVPSDVGDDVKIGYDPSTGVTKNWFGGDNYADGDRHGHIDVNEAGETTYIRDTDIKVTPLSSGARDGHLTRLWLQQNLITTIEVGYGKE